jgi:membrane associated rhomboid family serine protease
MGVDLYKYLGLFYFKSEYFHPYQLITFMFMHGGILHLLFNMYALFLFGSILERVWGAERFLLFYLFTGVGAGLTQLAVNWFMIHNFYNAVQYFTVDPTLSNFKSLISHYHQYFDMNKVNAIVANWSSYNINDIREGVNNVLQAQINIPTVGASGCDFGLLLAFGIMFPNVALYLFFIPVPIKAKYFVIGYGLLELYNGVQNSPGDHIAHFAHLGGMLFGFILLQIWYKGHFKQPN